MLALMRELTEAVGLPGYEAEIRSLMARHLSGWLRLNMTTWEA